MKEIQLTQGQIALVDDEDYEYLSQWKWHAYYNKETKSFYAKHTQTYYVDGVRKQKSIYMNRLVMNTPKGMKCDHKNHDTLNNQKDNLRNVTDSQNSMNRKSATSLNKSTGVLGVEMHSTGYRAHITINKRRKYFPVRRSIDEAIQDRRQAEQKYYGEFAFSGDVQ